MTSPSLLSQPAPLPSGMPRPMRPRELLTPLVLFLITMVSTTAVGMRYMYNFRRGLGPINSDADVLPYAWVLHNLRGLGQGLPFSLTLVAILLAHEFGHYFACRAYGVASTLPYMLPAPSLSGTFGAVIRLRSRVKTRAALIVIGASGPIAGFLVAIVTVAIGLAYSTYAETMPVLRNLEPPLLITSLHRVVGASGAPLHLLVPHPMLVASWIGLLITALNLIPAGQLDGGHILYAISPRVHRISSRVVTVMLVAMGVFWWAGWLIWALLLLLPAMRHPKVPERNQVKAWQYALIPACAVILLLAGTVQPFSGYDLLTIAHKLQHHRY